jgi:hypothetical protein
LVKSGAAPYLPGLLLLHLAHMALFYFLLPLYFLLLLLLSSSSSPTSPEGKKFVLVLREQSQEGKMQTVKFVARNTATGTACGAIYSNMLVVNIPVSKPTYGWTTPSSNRSKEVPVGGVYSEDLVCSERSFPDDFSMRISFPHWCPRPLARKLVLRASKLTRPLFHTTRLQSPRALA